MADALTFEEFVTTRSPAFLRLAYALTRNHAHAEDLWQTALARTWPAWKRVSGDPEPYVRRVLVNTHNSWWRRRWNGERATEVLPEGSSGHPQSTVDERDEVWRALGRLPKRQRAVLVLRYFEDLSEAQIAETLSMAPGTVKSYAAKGLARLRQDPSLLPVTIPPAPQGVERLAAVKERVRQRRRSRAVTIVAAFLALLALLLGSSAIVRSQSLEPADPDIPEYLDGHRIVAGRKVSFDQIRSGATFTWIPGSTTPRFYTMCQHDRPDDLWIGVEVTINGKGFGGGGCAMRGAAHGPGSGSIGAGQLREAGVRLGVPVQVRIELSDDLKSVGGTASVGIGEPVPWESYPFPGPPNRLEPLGLPPDSASTVLESCRAQAMTVDSTGRYELRATAQTPGLLHIRIDGVAVHTFSWWDYEAMLETVLVDVTTTGTLTVTPERMSGGWMLSVKPRQRQQPAPGHEPTPPPPCA
jgi:RNA polymerase sigma-70 factor (sigma-E family)